MKEKNALFALLLRGTYEEATIIEGDKMRTFYQGKGGGVYILHGTCYTKLTHAQVLELHINVFELEEFDYDLYKSAYSKDGVAEKVYILVGSSDNPRSKDVLAVKRTMVEAEESDRKFSEFLETDIYEWTIGEDAVFEP